MASNLAEKIGQITECCICNQVFRKPKHLLPCLHIFCQSCIERWARRRSINGTFPCPLCQRQVTIPRKGIRAFPDSYLATDLIDNLKSTSKAQVICTIHANTTISLYCTDCKLGICNDCLPFHEKHRLSSIHKQREELETEIKEKVRVGKQKQEELHKKRKDMVAVINGFYEQNCKIVDTFKRIMNEVTNRAKSVITQERARLVEDVKTVDKCIADLNDLLSQGHTEQEQNNLHNVREFMSRMEMLQKLNEAISVMHDGTKSVPSVKVKLKRKIDVVNEFDNYFLVEKDNDVPGQIVPQAQPQEIGTHRSNVSGSQNDDNSGPSQSIHEASALSTPGSTVPQLDAVQETPKQRSIAPLQSTKEDLARVKAAALEMKSMRQNQETQEPGQAKRKLTDLQTSTTVMEGLSRTEAAALKMQRSLTPMYQYLRQYEETQRPSQPKQRKLSDPQTSTIEQPVASTSHVTPVHVRDRNSESQTSSLAQPIASTSHMRGSGSEHPGASTYSSSIVISEEDIEEDYESESHTSDDYSETDDDNDDNEEDYDDRHEEEGLSPDVIPF